MNSCQPPEFNPALGVIGNLAAMEEYVTSMAEARAERRPQQWIKAIADYVRLTSLLQYSVTQLQ
jgi:hypothetical protein